MRVLHHRMKEKLTPITFKTWASWTISGLLEAMVGVNQVNIETSSPIWDTVFYKGKMMGMHWVLSPVE